MKKKLFSRLLLIIKIGLPIVVIALLVGGFLHIKNIRLLKFRTAKPVAEQQADPNAQPPEIAQLLAEKDPKKQKDIVHAMAEKYGPKQALIYMQKSGLPYTGETHLLVHEIGVVAYHKYGDDALLYCDESFLAACYHGVILNELADHGMSGLATMMQRCKEADVHVIAQCSHAAGHGFLALQDYNVLAALPMCDQLNSLEPAAPVFNCYDGVFMENIFGVHDGAPSPNRMVKDSDPSYPCDAVPEKYKNGCWADQATLMYQIFKGDLKKVAHGCDAVKNKEYQATCYNNFARQIHPLTQGQAGKAVELCSNATGTWKDDCLITLVTAAFSVGDMQHMPYELCADMKDSPRHNDCYTALFNNIAGFSHSSQDSAKFCGYVLEPDWVKQCETRFNVTAVVPFASASATNEFSAAASSSGDGGVASPADVKKLEDMAKQQGVEAAYNWLKQAYASNPTQGHELAHIIGKIAYEQKGTQGFSVCDSALGFGCYHGLLQTLIQDKGEQAIDVARQGCEGLGLQGQVVSCLHGIGHGIMGDRENVQSSVDRCQKFPDNEQPYCFDGVFMEYYTGVMKTQAQDIKPDFSKPWDLCMSMPQNSQDQCVRNAMFFLLYSGPDAVAPSVKACDSLDGHLKGGCIQSSGLFAAQVANGDTAKVQAVCKKFPANADQAYCIMGSAQEFVFEGKGAGLAQKLCQGLDSAYRQQCSDGVDTMEKNYGK